MLEPLIHTCMVIVFAGLGAMKFERLFILLLVAYCGMNAVQFATVLC